MFENYRGLTFENRVLVRSKYVCHIYISLQRDAVFIMFTLL